MSRLGDIPVLYDIFEEIVKDTACIYGKDIYYYAGDPLEINNKLGSKDFGGYKTYPAIFFFLSIDENQDNASYWGLIDPIFSIVEKTETTYKTEDRIEKVFKPVIYPIYSAFMEALRRSPIVHPGGNINHFTRVKRDNYFYGSENNTKKKLFGDKLDATTLSFSNVKISNPKCKKL